MPVHDPDNDFDRRFGKAEPEVKQPGEFTRNFFGMGAALEKAADEKDATPPPSSGLQGFQGPEPFPPAAQSAAGPGDFTRNFGVSGGGNSDSFGISSRPAARVPASRPAPAAEPGDFTRSFGVSSGGNTDSFGISSSPAASVPAPRPAPATGLGDFTQSFGTANPPGANAPVAAPPAIAGLSSAPAPAATGPEGRGPGIFTRMFKMDDLANPAGAQSSSAATGPDPLANRGDLFPTTKRRPEPPPPAQANPGSQANSGSPVNPGSMTGTLGASLSPPVATSNAPLPRGFTFQTTTRPADPPMAAEPAGQNAAPPRLSQPDRPQPDRAQPDRFQPDHAQPGEFTRQFSAFGAGPAAASPSSINPPGDAMLGDPFSTHFSGDRMPQSPYAKPIYETPQPLAALSDKSSDKSPSLDILLRDAGPTSSPATNLFSVAKFEERFPGPGSSSAPSSAPATNLFSVGKFEERLPEQGGPSEFTRVIQSPLRAAESPAPVGLPASGNPPAFPAPGFSTPSAPSWQPPAPPAMPMASAPQMPQASYPQMPSAPPAQVPTQVPMNPAFNPQFQAPQMPQAPQFSVAAPSMAPPPVPSPAPWAAYLPLILIGGGVVIVTLVVIIIVLLTR